MLSKLEELKLITLCVTLDDHRAFARLVDEYSPGLHGFIYNLTLGDAALTDDIAQETFLKAYSELRSFRGVSRFRTWLYRIAFNEFTDQMRRRTPTDDIASYADKIESGATADRSWQLSHDLAEAMASLSETERTIVLLFYHEDRPIKEIVKITGLAEGTVKSHLSRAKTKMAKTINEYRNDTE